MKKISIIIATFNAAETLSDCLNGIRVQKKHDIELLIIDGGSSDSTGEIVSQNKDIVDFYISEPDKGLYHAWNKGISKARGEWILFLGADDFLLPSALDKYRSFLDKNVFICEYISARAYYVDENDKLIKIIGEKWNWNTFKNRMTVSHVASLHKRSLFDEIGLFNLDFKICADYEFLMRKEDQLKALFIDEVVVKMKSGGVSLSKKAVRETCIIVNMHTKKKYLNRCIFALKKYMSYYLFLLRIKVKRFI